MTEKMDDVHDAEESFAHVSKERSQVKHHFVHFTLFGAAHLPRQSLLPTPSAEPAQMPHSMCQLSNSNMLSKFQPARFQTQG